MFFLKDDINFLSKKKEKYPLLKTKKINLAEKNRKEIKIFLTKKEYETSKNFANKMDFQLQINLQRLHF
ncbi:hypothetical protein CFT12S02225_02680 [Campylobacter fetus subsp. testudinum]|uniref:Uncharacterized protein n=1 Tax=Campylobacter fetus subsp. testudinum TaxID=1507806 RepID=A0AAX0HDF8_CAMFE|nr:hypothetical protein CFT12S02225_02680 [Campylobacter fetus subsp. testudinum]OCR93181.1 hypothetical protein CFT12S02263_02315 [Campylobacter fetus subsp. testudinum]